MDLLEIFVQFLLSNSIDILMTVINSFCPYKKAIAHTNTFYKLNVVFNKVSTQ